MHPLKAPFPITLDASCRRFQIAGRERLDDLIVLSPRCLHAIAMQKERPLKKAHPGLELIDDLFKGLIVRTLDEDSVKTCISVDATDRVFLAPGGSKIAIRCAEPRQTSVCGGLGLCNREAFEHPDERIQIVGELKTRRCYSTPPAGRGLYQAVVLEQPNSFSHRHRAGPELLSQGHRRQPGSSWQLAAENCIANPVIDLGALRRRVPQRPGGA
jgi:hypothetical protein